MDHPDFDRDPALLTPTQRRYIYGETDIEGGSSRERAVRSRIRERIKNTILDFYMIDSRIMKREIDGLFDVEAKNGEMANDSLNATIGINDEQNAREREFDARRRWGNSIQAAHSFLYALTKEHAHEEHPELMVERGIIESEALFSDLVVEADLSVEPVTQFDLGGISENLEEGDVWSLSDAERLFVLMLMSAGGSLPSGEELEEAYHSGHVMGIGPEHMPHNVKTRETDEE